MEQFFVLNNKDSIEISDSFLGNVFFYAKSKDEKIAETQLNLIQKLVQNGLKLDWQNILLIDINSKMRLNQLQKITSVSKCILFGEIESSVGLNFNLKKYHIQTIHSIQFLKADEAELLDKNAALKTKFWNELKKIFNIE